MGVGPGKEFSLIINQEKFLAYNPVEISKKEEVFVTKQIKQKGLQINVELILSVHGGLYIKAIGANRVLSLQQHPH